MSKKFLTPIGLLPAANDPAGVEGSIYYNTTEDLIKVFDGSTWNPVGTNSIVAAIDGGNASSVYYYESLDGGTA
jgi:hypothetical protein